MALSIEELERARMFGLVPQAPAQQPGVDPQVAQQLFDPMQMGQQMGQQQHDNLRMLAEKGVIGSGGIRASELNPNYGQTKNGIDWLKERYTPQEPARWGAEREGRRNVQERKEQQQADRVVRSNQMKGGVVQDGDVSRFYTGDTAQMAKDILTGGDLPQANMSMMPIDPRYGGGMGMGAQSGTTITSPELSAGWGTPMPAQEAYGYDQVGPGIYGPQDQSNPSSIYANKARQQGAAEKISRNLQGFYDRRNTAEQNPAVAPITRSNDNSSAQVPMEQIAQSLFDTETPPPPAMVRAPRIAPKEAPADYTPNFGATSPPKQQAQLVQENQARDFFMPNYEEGAGVIPNLWQGAKDNTVPLIETLAEYLFGRPRSGPIR